MMTSKAFRLCLIFCLGFGISAHAEFNLFNSSKVIRAHVTTATRLIEMPENFSRIHLSEYDDHVCWIKNPETKLWGLLDTLGNTLIEPRYTFNTPPKFYYGVCFLPYTADSIGLSTFLLSKGNIGLPVSKNTLDKKPADKKAVRGKSIAGKNPVAPALKGYFSIDHTGQILGYYPQFDEISFFSAGLANASFSLPVKKGKNRDNQSWFTYITPRGDILFPNLKQAMGHGSLHETRNLKEGLRAHYDYKKEKWGYIDAKGIWVIPPQFDWSGDFSCRRAIARIGDLWGYIDPKGKWVISPRYENEPNDFSESFSIIYKSGVAFEERVAIIDTMGNILLDKLEDALPFYKGVCFVNGRLGKNSSSKTFLLDKHLTVIKSIKRVVWGHGMNSESYPYFTQQLNTLLLGQIALSTSGEKVYESTEKLRPFYCNRSKVYTGIQESDTTRHWGFMNTSGEVVFLVLPRPKD